MIYVPTNLDIDESWKLSSELWERVSGVADGTTKYLVSPLKHPETGKVYFPMEEKQAMALRLDTSKALTKWVSEQNLQEY